VRKWAYETFGDERAIQFTVMATPEDLQANAESRWVLLEEAGDAMSD
jgi:hypothetical protein